MAPLSPPPPPSLRPSVRYAQNFLCDPRLVASLFDRPRIGGDGVVYEIGPGTGVLTEQLAQRYRRVVAIEKDPRLAGPLRRRFADRPHVTIRCGDFLDARLPRERYEVVANIPFNMTAAIVGKLTAAVCPPEDAYLAMQREAADTLRGSPRGNLRATLLKPWFAMEIVHRFRRADFNPVPRVDVVMVARACRACRAACAFNPVPRVDVVMVRLRKRGPPLVRRADRQTYRDFVSSVFTAWEPTVARALTRIHTRRHLRALRARLGFGLDVAPTALTFDQWLALFAAFEASGDEQARAIIRGSDARLMTQQRVLQ